MSVTSQPKKRKLILDDDDDLIDEGIPTGENLDIPEDPTDIGLDGRVETCFQSKNFFNQLSLTLFKRAKQCFRIAFMISNYSCKVTKFTHSLQNKIFLRISKNK